MPPLQPSAAVMNNNYSNNPNSGRRGQDRKPQPGRAASFHGRTMAAQAEYRQMRRPKTQPELLSGCRTASSPELIKRGSCFGGGRPEGSVPAKVLVNVTVPRSLGALQVLASMDWTVEDLVAAAVKLYVKEGRRPTLATTEPAAFGLHYSQFSLDCLDPNEKLIELGSRNFFLCPKAPVPPSISSHDHTAAASASPSSLKSSSCSNEAQKASKISIPFPWLKFMDFMF